MLTHVEYVKTVEIMKKKKIRKKMSRGEPITEKSNLEINTHYFLVVKSALPPIDISSINRL